MCMWSDFLCKLFVILNFLHGFNCETNGCGEEPSCLKCGSAGCTKCTNLIVQSSRKCVSSCPFGYGSKWSVKADYMGQMCVRTKSFLGLSADGASVLTGVLCGFALSVVIVASAAAYLKYKRGRLPQIVETNSDVDDSPEKRDFVKQLELLRPHAKTFLEMLNDTRRQMRELHNKGDNTAASAYKPVVRDLAKILLLLNRPVDMLAVPDNWERLRKWAQKILKRYRRMSVMSQTQVSQLVKFLQAPAVPNDREDRSRTSTSMSTFKPDQVFSSLSSLQAQSTFDTPLNPQWQFDYPLGCSRPIGASEFIPSQWKNSKEYLNTPYFLDDDFFQFGFRPQDEITTEL